MLRHIPQEQCYQFPCPCDGSLPTHLQKTLKHSQVGLAQSSMGSLYLSLQSWCAQSFIYVCQEWCLCFPPVLWEVL